MNKDFLSRIRVGASKSAPRILLYGVEGVGKSTAGAQCPDPIFLCAEDGLVGQGFDNVPSFAPEDWKDVLEFAEYVATGEHNYKTLVIDTLDWLEAIAYAYICKRDGKDNIEDYGYGKGYTIALAEFRKLLPLLDKVAARGVTVVVTAHSHIKPFANPAGENYDRYEMKSSKQIGGLVKEWVDAAFFAEFETYITKAKGEMKAKAVGTQNRIIHTQKTAAWDAKNRYGLPERLPLDMGTILAAIGNEDTSADADAVIAEIDSLIPSLPKDKQAASKDYVKKHKANRAKMAAMLNKLRVTINQTQEGTNE